MDALFDVQDKVVVVTGGSRGIGRMIATAFAERGARVYVSSRKADELAATADAIGATALPADLSGEQGCSALAAAVAEREPAVHVLVNNAGATWGAPLADYPEAAFDKVMSTNVTGPFLLTRSLLPQLEAAARPGDPARVIMVGSIEGRRVPEWENFAYPASKAAVAMLGRHLAQRLAPTVTVNTIAPGLFPSKMTQFVFDSGGGDAAAEHLIPLRRVGEPSDMGGVAVFLASRAAAYITGAVIPCDGGMSTRG